MRSYASRVKKMQMERLRGFLGGFIDLVFQWQDRWYLLDYKTNRLGKTLADYTAERLGAAMVHHDYLLQYHLYALALDRLLRQRVSDYDYECNFGGAIYLFTRGFVPAAGGSHGVYFHRPKADVIDAMSSALGEER